MLGGSRNKSMSNRLWKQKLHNWFRMSSGGVQTPGKVQRIVPEFMHRSNKQSGIEAVGSCPPGQAHQSTTDGYWRSVPSSHGRDTRWRWVSGLADHCRRLGWPPPDCIRSSLRRAGDDRQQWLSAGAENDRTHADAPVGPVENAGSRTATAVSGCCSRAAVIGAISPAAGRRCGRSPLQDWPCRWQTTDARNRGHRRHPRSRVRRGRLRAGQCRIRWNPCRCGRC